MKKLMKPIVGLLLISGLLMINSCQKEESSEESTLRSDARDNALAESHYDDLKDIADQAYDLSQGSGYKGLDNSDRPMLTPCATVTHDTLSNPRRIIIDFGPVNCLCNDGKYRRGKIIITYTGRYMQPGAIITFGFEDYYVNDNHVEGSKVVTNQGLNNSNQMWWSIEINGTITKPDGATFTWVSSRQRAWIAGMGTPRRWDDVFLITGNAAGTRPNGVTFTSQITNPLRRELSCRWIVSGTIELTPSNRPARILDYGDGTCDRFATLTIGNRSRTITLP